MIDCVYSASAESKSLSLLLVDDSISERLVVAKQLKKLGHCVIDVSSAQEAIHYLSQPFSTIDLIITDVAMPDIDGFALTRQIRQLERERIIPWRPILYLSGYTSAEHFAAGIESGGDDFISKPANLVMLNAKLTAMHRIKQMRDQLIQTGQQLRTLATTDELTGLSNRRHWLHLLEEEIKQSKRYNVPVSIAWIDFDHFKKINDQYGHDAGDLVLTQVTKRIKSMLRDTDELGRLGGEEFCLLLRNISAEQAKALCERLRKAVAATEIERPATANPLKITISIGITQLLPTDTSTSLLARGDHALYAAKDQGRNRVIAN